MKLTLPSDVEAALITEARRQGATPEHLAIEYLRSRFLNGVPQTSEQTLADFLGDSIGCLSSDVPGGSRMSEQTGKKFAEGLEEKRLARTTMILTDTGPLVALLDKRDVNHAACADAAVAETRSLKQIFTLDTDFRFYRLADGSVLDIIPPLS